MTLGIPTTSTSALHTDFVRLGVSNTLPLKNGLLSAGVSLLGAMHPQEGGHTVPLVTPRNIGKARETKRRGNRT